MQYENQKNILQTFAPSISTLVTQVDSRLEIAKVSLGIVLTQASKLGHFLMARPGPCFSRARLARSYCIAARPGPGTKYKFILFLQKHSRDGTQRLFP
jgi:hypothetical protein